MSFNFKIKHREKIPKITVDVGLSINFVWVGRWPFKQPVMMVNLEYSEDDNGISNLYLTTGDSKGLVQQRFLALCTLEAGVMPMELLWGRKSGEGEAGNIIYKSDIYQDMQLIRIHLMLYMGLVYHD